jgi:hypothetical protein
VGGQALGIDRSRERLIRVPGLQRLQQRLHRQLTMVSKAACMLRACFIAGSEVANSFNKTVNRGLLVPTITLRVSYRYAQ